GRGDVVGEVGHHLTGRIRRAIEERGGRQSKDIPRDDAHIRTAADGGVKRLQESAVDLDGGHPAGALRQPGGQRAHPRSDLEHAVRWGQGGGGERPAERLGADEEMLAPPLRRPDPELPEDCPRAGGGGQVASAGGCRALPQGPPPISAFGLPWLYSMLRSAFDRPTVCRGCTPSHFGGRTGWPPRRC